MVSNKSIRTLLITATLFFHACRDGGSAQNYSKAQFSIEPLPSLNRDTMVYRENVKFNNGFYRYRVEYYAVAGYEGIENLTAVLDSFVCANLFDGHEIYDSYSIDFYKKTDYINFSNFINGKKNFSRFFDSRSFLLYGYTFNRGKFKASARYYEGHDPDVYDSLSCLVVEPKQE